MFALLIGLPGMGKTSLALRSVEAARKHGLEVLVYDPRLSTVWGKVALLTDDVERLGRVALAQDWQRRPATVRCLVVVDEAGFDEQAARPMLTRLATQYRHHGHSVLAIAHYYKQLPPAVRTGAADTLYLYQQGIDQARQAAQDWNRPELVQAVDLEKGQALKATRTSRQVEKLQNLCPC